MSQGNPEIIRTYAERLAHEADERLQKRQLILAEQCSRENPPDRRIRAWETAHALRLPSDPEHPVLYSVANCTGLTLEQVQEEQRLRGARRSEPRPGQADLNDAGPRPAI